MTTELVVEEGQEPRSASVARRVRGLMAEQQVRQAELAQALSLSQQAFSRRAVGVTDFAINEVEALSRILGVTEAYLYGFTNERNPRPITRTGDLYGIRDSNPEPADLVPAGLLISLDAARRRLRPGTPERRSA